MNDLGFFNGFLTVMTVVGMVLCYSLYMFDVGYGQYLDRRWGRTVTNKVGWVIMELPVVILFFCYWIFSERRFDTVPLIFFVLFNLHYCQRTFVFPLLIRGKDQMPWSVIILGMLFNTANAYMQGAWIFWLAPPTQYVAAWLTTPQFLVGLPIFLAGYAINLHSDHVIRNLRKPGDTAFYIPRGGMFEYVSAANYFGEFTEWVGWAVMTWSWAGFVFALWTFSNLGPRAHRHHQWYLEKFGAEYPRHRKRMIPFVY